MSTSHSLSEALQEGREPRDKAKAEASSLIVVLRGFIKDLDAGKDSNTLDRHLDEVEMGIAKIRKQIG